MQYFLKFRVLERGAAPVQSAIYVDVAGRFALQGLCLTAEGGEGYSWVVNFFSWQIRTYAVAGCNVLSEVLMYTI